ncbi:hypothetical protein DFH27DRAFT_156627 [Peziza echinospora]|nr:hypothetical protein DFH27DRAFT_156627 [Peziza echinospora]
MLWQWQAACPAGPAALAVVSMIHTVVQLRFVARNPMPVEIWELIAHQALGLWAPAALLTKVKVLYFISRVLVTVLHRSSLALGCDVSIDISTHEISCHLPHTIQALQFFPHFPSRVWRCHCFCELDSSGVVRGWMGVLYLLLLSYRCLASIFVADTPGQSR